MLQACGLLCRGIQTVEMGFLRGLEAFLPAVELERDHSSGL
jgi:hypothetical protein